MPQRIQRKRTKGWRMPPNTIYVGRGTQWGNPYKVGHMGVGWLRLTDINGKDLGLCSDRLPVKDREQAVHLFRSLLHDSGEHCVIPMPVYPSIEEITAKLHGKNLACWCPLDAPCHADVLLEIAN